MPISAVNQYVRYCELHWALYYKLVQLLKYNLDIWPIYVQDEIKLIIAKSNQLSIISFAVLLAIFRVHGHNVHCYARQTSSSTSTPESAYFGEDHENTAITKKHMRLKAALWKRAMSRFYANIPFTFSTGEETEKILRDGALMGEDNNGPEKLQPSMEDVLNAHSHVTYANLDDFIQFAARYIYAITYDIKDCVSRCPMGNYRDEKYKALLLTGNVDNASIGLIFPQIMRTLSCIRGGINRNYFDTDFNRCHNDLVLRYNPIDYSANRFLSVLCDALEPTAEFKVRVIVYTPVSSEDIIKRYLEIPSSVSRWKHEVELRCVPDSNMWDSLKTFFIECCVRRKEIWNNVVCINLGGIDEASTTDAMIDMDIAQRLKTAYKPWSTKIDINNVIEFFEKTWATQDNLGNDAANFSDYGDFEFTIDAQKVLSMMCPNLLCFDVSYSIDLSAAIGDGSSENIIRNASVAARTVYSNFNVSKVTFTNVNLQDAQNGGGMVKLAPIGTPPQRVGEELDRYQGIIQGEVFDSVFRKETQMFCQAFDASKQAMAQLEIQWIRKGVSNTALTNALISNAVKHRNDEMMNGVASVQYYFDEPSMRNWTRQAIMQMTEMDSIGDMTIATWTGGIEADLKWYISALTGIDSATITTRYISYLEFQNTRETLSVDIGAVEAPILFYDRSLENNSNVNFVRKYMEVALERPGRAIADRVLQQVVKAAESQRYFRKTFFKTIDNITKISDAVNSAFDTLQVFGETINEIQDGLFVAPQLALSKMPLIPAALKPASIDSSSSSSSSYLSSLWTYVTRYISSATSGQLQATDTRMADGRAVWTLDDIQRNNESTPKDVIKERMARFKDVTSLNLPFQIAKRYTRQAFLYEYLNASEQFLVSFFGVASELRTSLAMTNAIAEDIYRSLSDDLNLNAMFQTPEYDKKRQTYEAVMSELWNRLNLRWKSVFEPIPEALAYYSTEMDKLKESFTQSKGVATTRQIEDFASVIALKVAERRLIKNHMFECCIVLNKKLGIICKLLYLVQLNVKKPDS